MKGKWIKMQILSIPYNNIQIFFLIFLRIASISMSMPLFESSNVPMIFKIGLAFTISIAIYPIVPKFSNIIDMEICDFIVGAIGEVILGLIIGYSIRLVFTGIQLGGQTAGNQMGFGLSRVIDPVSGSEANAISQFYNLTAILIFFAINAHHIFLKGIVESFRIVPILNFNFSGPIMLYIIKLFSGMFIIAVKIGSPLIVALLLTSVSLGLVARTVPQMNIFIVALPIKILGGIIFLGFCIPYIRYFIDSAFNSLGNDIYIILNLSK